MLVFRTSERQPEPKLPDDIRFIIIDDALSALKISPAFMRSWGVLNTMKMIFKSSTTTRTYYALIQDGVVVSDGWIMRGGCVSYAIGKEDYVIGPINTPEINRGRGLAHMSLVRAINFCLGRGGRWVYIDTIESNISSRRVIEKSGMRICVKE